MGHLPSATQMLADRARVYIQSLPHLEDPAGPTTLCHFRVAVLRGMNVDDTSESEKHPHLEL